MRIVFTFFQCSHNIIDGGGAGSGDASSSSADAVGSGFGSTGSGWVRRALPAPPAFDADPATKYFLYTHGEAMRPGAGAVPPAHVSAATAGRGERNQRRKFLGSHPGPAAAGWALFAEGSPEPVIEGFGSLGGWTIRNAAAFTALLCGLEDARAAGVKRLEVFTPTALCIKHLPARFRAAAFGPPARDGTMAWLRGLKAAIVEELGGFDSVTVKATPGDDDGARTASRLASFGIDDEPMGGETANTNNQLDRVLLARPSRPRR